jgi:hypothetical protein
LLGVVGICKSENSVSRLGRPLHGFFDFRVTVALQNARSKRFGYNAAELVARRGEYVGREAEGRKQRSEALPAETWHKAEFDPSSQFARVAHEQAPWPKRRDFKIA